MYDYERLYPNNNRLTKYQDDIVSAFVMFAAVAFLVFKIFKHTKKFLVRCIWITNVVFVN